MKNHCDENLLDADDTSSWDHSVWDNPRLSWNYLPMHRHEFRQRIQSRLLEQMPPPLQNFYQQLLDYQTQHASEMVVPLKAPIRRLTRRYSANDTPKVWLLAAADSDPMTVREISIQDDFGTEFILSLLTDKKDSNWQILRVHIKNEKYHDNYEGKNVYIMIGDEQSVKVRIEGGYAKARIPVITAKTFIKIQSELEDNSI